MQSFSSIIASNVALSALLALFALAATRVWRNPHVAHVLWLLVLLKLITPPGVGLTLPEHWLTVETRTAAPASGHESPSPVPEPLPGAVHPPEAAALPEQGRAASPSGAALDSPPVVLPNPEPGSTRVVTSAELAPRADERPFGTGPLPSLQPPSLDLPTLAVEDTEVPRGGTTIAVPDTASRDSARPLVGLIRRASTWGPLLLAAWAAGTLASTAVAVRRCLSFRGIVARSLEADADLSAETGRLARALGLRHAPPVRIVSAHIPPLVWGCGLWPLVLLPRELLDGLDPVQRRTVVAHELAHIRRRDHLVRWLEVLVLSVFWWNPVAWYARRRLRQAEEECCDACVVWALPADRRSYGQALLRTIEFLTEGRPRVSVAGSAFGGFPFKRRIEMILKRSASPKMSRGAWAAMLLLTALVLPVTAQVVPTDPPATAEVDAAPAAASAEPIPAVSPVVPAEPAAADVDDPPVNVVPPVNIEPPAAGPASAPFPPSSPRPATSPRTVPAEAAPPSADADPAPDRAGLEARLERLERLVETLIAERRRTDPAQTTGPRWSYGIEFTPPLGLRSSDHGFRSSDDRPRADSGAAVPADGARAALAARRVAVSRDGKLAAILTPGQRTSLIEIHAVESGGVLSVISVAGRATEIRFTGGGHAVSVKVGDEWKSYAAPDGRELPAAGVPSSSDSSGARPSTSVTRPSGSPAETAGLLRERERLQAVVEATRATLADFLKGWEPQERLLKIDVRQAELKLEAAQTKLDRLHSLQRDRAVSSDLVHEHEFAARQAQLDVERARTQLDIHQEKRNAAEAELKQAADGASQGLEELLKRHPRLPTDAGGRSRY